MLDSARPYQSNYVRSSYLLRSKPDGYITLLTLFLIYLPVLHFMSLHHMSRFALCSIVLLSLQALHSSVGGRLRAPARGPSFASRLPSSRKLRTEGTGAAAQGSQCMPKQASQRVYACVYMYTYACACIHIYVCSCMYVLM